MLASLQVILTITPEDASIVLEKMKNIPKAPKPPLVSLEHRHHQQNCLDWLTSWHLVGHDFHQNGNNFSCNCYDCNFLKMVTKRFVWPLGTPCSLLVGIFSIADMTKNRFPPSSSSSGSRKPLQLNHLSSITNTTVMPSEQDLEDFSTAHGGELSGYVSALHVANFLRFGMIFKLMISMHYAPIPM